MLWSHPTIVDPTRTSWCVKNKPCLFIVRNRAGTDGHMSYTGIHLTNRRVLCACSWLVELLIIYIIGILCSVWAHSRILYVSNETCPRWSSCDLIFHPNKNVHYFIFYRDVFPGFKIIYNVYHKRFTTLNI